MRYSTVFGADGMSRRWALLALPAAFVVPASACAQISQRARQVRERRACEQDLPTCRPEIRAQLLAERQRMRWGLSGLGMAVVIMVLLLWRRRSIDHRKEAKQLSRLHNHVAEVSGKTDRNQAQLKSHESEET